MSDWLSHFHVHLFLSIHVPFDVLECFVMHIIFSCAPCFRSLSPIFSRFELKWFCHHIFRLSALQRSWYVSCIYCFLCCTKPNRFIPCHVARNCFAPFHITAVGFHVAFIFRRFYSTHKVTAATIFSSPRLDLSPFGLCGRPFNWGGQAAEVRADRCARVVQRPSYLLPAERDRYQCPA